MKRADRYWLSIAFAATFLVSFIAMYWNGLEPRMEFPAGTKWMLACVVLASALCRSAGETPLVPTIVVVGLAAPAGELAVVVVALLRDPSSANLWPLAVLAVGAIGFIAATAGALVGGAIRSLIR